MTDGEGEGGQALGEGVRLLEKGGGDRSAAWEQPVAALLIVERLCAAAADGEMDDLGGGRGIVGVAGAAGARAPARL